MVSIEQISNGFIVSFKNTDGIKVKLYFDTFENLSTWLKTQFVKG